MTSTRDIRNPSEPESDRSTIPSARPRPTVAGALAGLGLPCSQDQLSHLGDGRVEVAASHGIAGNPARFKAGEITLRPDEAWREHLPPRDRRLVTALEGGAEDPSALSAALDGYRVSGTHLALKWNRLILWVNVVSSDSSICCRIPKPPSSGLNRIFLPSRRCFRSKRASGRSCGMDPGHWKRLSGHGHGCPAATVRRFGLQKSMDLNAVRIKFGY